MNPTFDEFMAALSAELSRQMGVQPGDFAAHRDAAPPSPEATPIAWTHGHEGTEL